MAQNSSLILWLLLPITWVGLEVLALQNALGEDGDRIVFEDELSGILEKIHDRLGSEKGEEEEVSSDIFINGQYVSDKRHMKKEEWSKNPTVVGVESTTEELIQVGWGNGRPQGSGGNKPTLTGGNKIPTQQTVGGEEIASTDNSPPHDEAPIDYYNCYLPHGSGFHFGPFHFPPVYYYWLNPFHFVKKTRQKRSSGNWRRNFGGGAIQFPGPFSGTPFGNSFPSSTPRPPRRNQQQARQTQPTTPSATPNPDCMRNCPTTPEYNPICGNDAVTYTNPGKLSCTVRCGKRVQVVYYGNCIATTNGPQNPTRAWNLG